MSYPQDDARTERADYCEAGFLAALAAGEAQWMRYWARQEMAALYPDGRRGDR